IWLDESYCNQHHVARYSYYRPGDVVKRGNKGRRWIIVHAGGSCGWVGEPMVFEAKHGSGDYHENMNWTVFRNYFDSLCQWMQDRYPGKKVIFHMDNAAYHKKIEGMPATLSAMKKSQLQDWLRQNGATEELLAEYKTKKQLYELARGDPRFKGIPNRTP